MTFSTVFTAVCHSKIIVSFLNRLHDMLFILIRFKHALVSMLFTIVLLLSPDVPVYVSGRTRSRVRSPGSQPDTYFLEGGVRYPVQDQNRTHSLVSDRGY